MRELDDRLATWRREIAAALPGQHESIRELEAHLRDHVEARMRAGLPLDAAFEEALQRLGDTHRIAREFRQAHSASAGRWWPIATVAGALGLVLATLLVILGQRFSAGRMDLLLVIHVFLVTAGYFSVFAAGALAACSLLVARSRSLSTREREQTRGWLTRFATAAAVLVPLGVVLGSVWASENLEGAWTWHPRETGALAILSWAAFLAVLLRCSGVSDRAIWAAAILGNAVTAAGWFGAGALSHGASIPWLCVAFIASQIAVALLRPAQAFERQE